MGEGGKGEVKRAASNRQKKKERILRNALNTRIFDKFIVDLLLNLQFFTEFIMIKRILHCSRKQV